MMKLADLLKVMDDDTKICICDNMGPITNACPLKDIRAIDIIGDANRIIERVYFDASDGSIVIELEDYQYED